MIDKTMRLLILLTVVMGLTGTDRLGAEPLPPRALARIGDHRFYHGPDIQCAALSPDGRCIASAAHYEFDTFGVVSYTRNISDKQRDAYDPIIVLWDTATGERLGELRVPHAPIGCLAFSPDGKRLAVTTSAIFDDKYGLFVFALETGKLIWQQGNFKHWLNNLHFSADGQRLSANEWRGPVRAWNAATGNQLRLWKPPADEGDYGAESGVLSPDGKRVAWEMNRISERKWPGKSVGLRVQDADTEQLLYQIKFKSPDHLESFAFFSDGKRLAADRDGKFTVWETSSGKKLMDLDVPEMTRFALASDGRHAAIYEFAGSRLRLWDLKIGKPSQDYCFGILKVGRSLAFSSDGKTLLLLSDSTLRLFDTTTGKERAVPGHRAPVQCRFSTDGRTLLTFCAEKRCSWDVSPGKEPTLLRHEARKGWEFECLAHSADNQFFLDKSEDGICVRETATGRVLRKLEGSRYKAWRGLEYPTFGLFSPDATQVLLWYRGYEQQRLRLYDAKTGKASGEIETEQEGYPVMFSPRGRLIACANGNDVHLHDATTGKIVRTLRSSRPLPEAEPNGARLLFSPDGERLIVATYHYDRSKPLRERRTTLPARVFQVSSGREIGRFYSTPEKRSNAAKFSCAAWSPDGRLLAVAEMRSGTIRLIEIASGQVRVEFAEHRHGVHGLAFAPDGQTLASGGEDNVVFLWDVIGARTGGAANKASENDLATWWSDLASADGNRAGIAIASLLRKPEASVAFLQQRLRPAVRDDKRLARLLADLDDDAFETREAASRELTRLGERAETALRRALNDRPSPEVQRRIEDVLNKLEPCSPPPETLRTLRAMEVLEHIGTPAARRCLEVLAKGAADARPTQDAKAALQRLAKRRG